MEDFPPFHVRVLSWLRTLFHYLFGTISWTSPPWLTYLNNIAVKWGKVGICCFLLLDTAITGGYVWYRYRPHRSVIIAKIDSIESSRSTLRIDFMKDDGEGSLSPVSVAPLHLIEKKVETGIKIKPKIEGEWHWSNDKTLLFFPSLLAQWEAEKTYRITFDPSAFDKDAEVASYQYEVTTAPLKISVNNFKIYHDPRHFSVHQVIGTLKTNFRVDLENLEKHTHLVMQESDDSRSPSKHLPFYFTYTPGVDPLIYLKSEPIDLPQDPRFVTLILDKGIKAIGGTSVTQSVSKQKLLMPSVETILQVKDVTARIEFIDGNQPEQQLHIETTIGMNHGDDIVDYVQAYVLPQDYPETAFFPIRKNYQWSQPGEVTPEVLQLATPVTLVPLPKTQSYPTRYHFKFNTLTPSYLYVRVKKGMEGGRGYYPLSEDYAAVIRSPECSKEIKFTHQGSLLAATGEKKINVAVRGTPEVRFSIGRVIDDRINHLMAQTHGNFQDPSFNFSEGGREGMCEIFHEYRQFKIMSPCDVRHTVLDLERYLLENANHRGLFLLKAEEWDAKNQCTTHIGCSRLILITDLDLLVKNNADHTSDLFVQSITQGDPVNNAEVFILGKNSLPIAAGQTDEQGHVHFPSMKGFEEDREPTGYLVRKEDDVSFIPYCRGDRRLNYSRFAVDGVDHLQTNLSAYLFTPRGMYRPGEKVHVGVIVKGSFAAPLAPGLPLEAVITDSQGLAIYSQKMTLPESHFLEFDYTFPETTSTGKYTVKLFVVKDHQSDHLLGSHSLRVEEFLPDRMKMAIHFQSSSELANDEPSSWHSPDGLIGKISLSNLFGTVAAKHRVKGKLVLVPHEELQFKKFAGYRFATCTSTGHCGQSMTLSDLLTDDDGMAQFHFNLTSLAPLYQLHFTAEGFESGGGRAVTSEASTWVTPSYMLMGYQVQGDLKYLKENQQKSIHCIAVTPQLQQVASQLKVELCSLNPESTLVKRNDGLYAYQTVTQKKTEWVIPFDIGIEGNSFEIPTEAKGNFILFFKDFNGQLLSEIHFSVIGEGDIPTTKSEELTVKLDKAIYRPGETIEMQINAPYTGAGLIAIERDRVYTYQWFKADTTSSIQKIAIPEDFQGDGYVNVSFVRDWDSPEMFINPLSYAVVPFKINKEKHQLQLQLNVPSVVHGGQPLPIQYQTDKPSKIVVFVVDEGILSLDRYQTPDPLAHFFRKPMLSVTTYQIADLILPKYRSKSDPSAVGGDKRGQSFTMHRNPFKRKSEPAAAFWSGILESDGTPRTVLYQVPSSFNGTLRVMAVAVGSEGMGNKERNVVVKNDFIIQPQVPTFVAPEDDFIATATIVNCSELADDVAGESDSVTVRIASSPHFDLVGPTEIILNIPPGEERLLSFRLKAKEILGDAHIIVTAEQGNKLSEMTSTVSVRPASAYRTSLISGFDRSANAAVEKLIQFYPDHRRVDAVASTNPLILAKGLSSYLERYPYDCTEQLVSKSLVQLIMGRQPIFALDPVKVQDGVNQTIQMLRERQTASGGFTYWPGGRENSSHEMASLCAMEYLIEAKTLGYPVPNELFKEGIKFLNKLSKSIVSTIAEARRQAYAIYLLTRLGTITTHDLTHLQLYLTDNHADSWHRDVICAYLASTHQLLKNSKEADRLLKKMSPLSEIKTDNDFFHPLACRAQYLTLLSRHFPDRLNNMGGEAIVAIAQGLSSNQLNTLSAAYSAQALAAYAQRQGTSHTNKVKTIEMDEETGRFSFQNPERELFFYQVTQSGFDKEYPVQPIVNGLEVHREYRDDHNKLTGAVGHGDQLSAHIVARTKNTPFANHIAIVDLLPGGFEVVASSIDANQCDRVDIREDRVIFYCTLDDSPKRFTYKQQAVNKGEYTIPPIYAQSMYDQLEGRGIVGRIVVK